MASPLNRASDRFGRFGPLIVGLVGVAAGLVMLGVFTGYAGISLGMAVFGLGYGIVFPAAAALVIGAAGADRRGMAFGIFYAVYSLGVVVGASGSGILAGSCTMVLSAFPSWRQRPLYLLPCLLWNL